MLSTFFITRPSPQLTRSNVMIESKMTQQGEQERGSQMRGDSESMGQQGGQQAGLARRSGELRSEGGSELRPDGRSSPLARGQAAESQTPVMPVVDIFEDEHGVTIMADLPGVPREGLGVRVDGDTLVIEGAAESPETGEMELLYGEVLNPLYRRSFTLSRDLDASKVEAQLNNGVLKLTIPKAEEAKPRRIDVKVGKSA
jgi:HSP20 family molecular chaperone IbpA